MKTRATFCLQHWLLRKHADGCDLCQKAKYYFTRDENVWVLSLPDGRELFAEQARRLPCPVIQQLAREHSS